MLRKNTYHPWSQGVVLQQNCFIQHKVSTFAFRNIFTIVKKNRGVICTVE